MKLIIEKDESGHVYAYSETESHFRKANKSRMTPRIDNASGVLALECNLDHMPVGHMVWDLKPNQAKNKKRK